MSELRSVRNFRHRLIRSSQPSAGPDEQTKGRTPKICSQLKASKFKCQNMRFNGTGRTKVYHIFINIMREGALARARTWQNPSIKNPILEKRAS